MGRHFRSQQTREALKRAIDHFQRAVELDPRNALAHAGLADACLGLATYRILPPGEAYGRAKAAAAEALARNPSLSVSLAGDLDTINGSRSDDHESRDPTKRESACGSSAS